jgi:hypothetical protein
VVTSIPSFENNRLIYRIVDQQRNKVGLQLKQVTSIIIRTEAYLSFISV